MRLRKKTKQRLLILLVAFAVIGGAMITFVAVRNAHTRADAAVNRELAIAAAKDDRHAEALSLFGPIMRFYMDNDPDVLYWAAHARREIPMPNGKHIRETIDFLVKAIKLKPAFTEAEHDLLKAYVQSGSDSEAISLADRLLARDPVDKTALLTKAGVLDERLGKREEALQIIERGIVAHPDEYRFKLYKVSLLAKLKRPPGEILAFARQLQEPNPDDPASRFILGAAHDSVGDRTSALEILKPLAKAAPPSEEFLAQLVMALDGMGQFDESLNALENGARILNTPDARRVWIRRLFEAGRVETVLQTLADLDPTSPAVHSDLIATKAMALVRADRAAEVVPLLDALRKRSYDPRAQAWALVLGHATDAPSAEKARSTLSVLNEAITKDPYNQYLHNMMGDLQEQMGENENALQSWARAANYAQSWYTPFLRIATTLGAMGRYQEAMGYTDEALRRAPGNASVVQARIEIAYSMITAGFDEPTARARLLDSMAEFQRQLPNHPTIVVRYIDMLARGGEKEKALELLRGAISDPARTPNESTLLTLASISRQNELGVEEELLTRCEQLHGFTPALLNHRAEALIEDSGPAAARAYLGDRLARLEPKELAKPLWRLTAARLLDRIGDETAKPEWVRLAGDFPDSLPVQRAALEARCLRGDRAVLDPIVQRIKVITGDSGIAWRLAEVRVLTDGNPSDADLRNAVTQLTLITRDFPDSVEARVMLANIFKRRGDDTQAVEQLRQVATIQPQNLAVLFSLAEFQLDRGETAEAKSQLDAIPIDRLSSYQRVQAAVLRLRMDDAQACIDLIDPIYQSDPSHVGHGLLLVRAYVRLKQSDKSLAVLARLMEKPSPEVIDMYAQVMASVGKTQESAAALQRLNDPSIDPYDREMTLAQFHKRDVRDNAGLDLVAGHLRAAAKLRPTDPRPLLSLISLYVEFSRPDEALRVNAEARDALPAHPIFTLIHNEEPLIRFAAQRPILQPVLAMILRDDPRRELAIEVLRILLKSTTSEDPAITSRALTQVVDRAPRSVELQNIMTDWYMSIRDLPRAAESASQNLYGFPYDASTAERATRVALLQQNWKDALNAANEWRKRDPKNAYFADVEAARCMIQLGEPKRALARLEPYRESALQNPEQYQPFVTNYTGALVRDGRIDDAATLLKPLLTLNPTWRSLWLDLAAVEIKDHATSVQWVERVTPTIPANAQDAEHFALARAWARLALRAKDPAGFDKALAVVLPLAQRPDAPPATLKFYGVLLYQYATFLLKDTSSEPRGREMLTEVDRTYRRVIELDPNSWETLNNLAILITERAGSLDEAAGLAQKAVQNLPPDVPASQAASVHDSVAHIAILRGKFPDAIASLNTAAKLDPTNPEWLVNLAYATSRNGDTKGAAAILDKLPPTDQLRNQLTEQAIQRLMELRR